jgi:ribonuclease R
MVFSMLPEKLANGICSLVPGQDRLAMVAKIYFDHSGEVRKSTFFKAVIQSHQRFTYKKVQKLLDGRDKRLNKKYRPFTRTLHVMAELAGLLMEKRRERGSIDFDLPESEVILGLTGELEAIVKRERSMAHRLIEEFMIAANEAVARFLSQRSIPTLYRIHEPPEREKIQDLVDFLRTLGHNIKTPKKISPFWCQKILAMGEGRPEEYVVNSMLLRTMNQAVYSPENKGHFGLASPTYLHFTSPIRRYPDLIVHRVLKGNLRRVRKRPVYNNEELSVLGQKLSQEERNAMEAEREMLDRLKVRYMEERIGEVFHGIISSVTSFGMFVELKEILISGLVRLVDMADDYYEFDSKRHVLRGRRTGKTYKLGQEVTLRLISVNRARRHINFEIVQEGK